MALLTLMLPEKFPAKPLPVRPNTPSPALREFDPPSKNPPSPSTEPMQHGPPPPPRPKTPLPPLNPPPPSPKTPVPPVLKVVVVSPLPPKLPMPSPPFALEPLGSVKPAAPMAGKELVGELTPNWPAAKLLMGPTNASFMNSVPLNVLVPVNVLFAANLAKAPGNRPPSLAAFTLVRAAPLPESDVAV